MKFSNTDLVHSESCTYTIKRDAKPVIEDCANQFLHFQADFGVDTFDLPLLLFADA